VRPVWSLKNLLTLAVSLMAFITLAVAAALIVLTTQLHRAADTLGDALQSVRVTEESAVSLLLHSRANDPLVLAAARTEVREYLRRAERHVSTPEEAAMLRGASDAVERYFASGAVPDMQNAYHALEALVDLNVLQAREAHEQANRWSELGNVIGVGGAVTLASLVLVTIVWLRRRAFSPLFSLGDAMGRFSHGDRESRAPVRGPAELRLMAGQFNALADSLARQREARVALLAGVAHDLRNPLAALRLSVALLTNERALPREDLVRSTAARLQRQIARLDRLVGDFQDVAHIEAGKLTLNCTECDLTELARTVVELFQPTSVAHELDVHVPAEPLVVWCDGMRIEQVLNNLVNNAIKYSPEGGRILVEVTSGEGHACISVTDRGVGIDPAEIKSIFDPFRRAQDASHGIPGLGLGLYIARLIVEAHGGRVDVASRPGDGSKFTIVLKSIARAPSASKPLAQAS
jgi:two-component system, OmpR family, sensor histidine kinase MtrB